MQYFCIDDQSPDSLLYAQWGNVVVFDTTDTSHHDRVRTITVSHNTRLEWYGFPKGKWQYDLHFITESGESVVRMLLLAKNSSLSTTVHSQLSASHTLTDIHIISLVGEAGLITLNGIVEIASDIQKVSGHILEENIFLGSTGQIRGIPSLLVHSDDVQAGHAARIERIPDEKLYYLRARGIPHDDATVMMIRSSVFGLFSGLEDAQKETIMSQILALI